MGKNFPIIHQLSLVMRTEVFTCTSYKYVRLVERNDCEVNRMFIVKIRHVLDNNTVKDYKTCFSVCPHKHVQIFGKSILIFIAISMNGNGFVFGTSR